MGLETNPHNAPGGSQRDQSDFARLRHAREQHRGFSVGQFLQPAPMLFTRDGHNVFLGDLYRGHTAFLICGGPSLTSHDVTKLQSRGILTLAVNNAATVVRPNLWCSVDDPTHFSEAIWYDPGILKFFPLCHMEKRFAVRNAAGELEDSRELVGDMPGVFGFRRNENFVAEQFLREDTFNWGNHGDVKDDFGNKGARSVMYIALRLLHYLGVRRVFLLGCDFKMELGKKNYAFEQDRSRSSVNGNNRTYEVLNIRLAALQPHFATAGFEIFNCTPDSGLKVFPHIDYEVAIERATELIPKQIVTAGMYDRKKQKTDRTDRDPKSRAASPITQKSVDAVRVSPEEDKSGLAESREVSVLIPMRAETSETFAKVCQTWEKNKPWMQGWPTIVLKQAEDAVTGIDRPSVRAVAAPSIQSEANESWGRTMLRAAATLAETDLIWILDPKAIATSKIDWMCIEKIGPTRDAVLTGPSWGYAKPASVFDDLDIWHERTNGHAESSPLRMPGTRGRDRVEVETVAGWSLLLKRSWLRDLDTLVEADLPCADLATFLFYCARREHRTIDRIDMKKHGWDHSYGWSPREVIRRCDQILRKP